MIKGFTQKKLLQKEYGYSRYKFNKLYEEGKIIKLDRGYYSVKDLLMYCLKILLKD